MTHAQTETLTAGAELVLIALLVFMAEAVEVLEGTRKWAVLCADNSVVLPMLGDKSVGVLLTDPPFSARLHGVFGNEARNDGVAPRAALDFGHLTEQTVSAICSEMRRLLCRWALVFCDELAFGMWHRGWTEAALEYVRMGTWVKSCPMPQLTGDRPAAGTEQIFIGYGWRPPRRNSIGQNERTAENFRNKIHWNGGGRAAVWHANNQEPGREHPTQKPIALMLELVELFTDPDEVVLDPFAGSGTTGVACLRLGRRFIGIEKSSEYAAIAQERLEAESKGLTLRDARAGQQSLFGDARELPRKDDAR